VEKTCTKCGETKPLSAYRKQRDTKDGYSYHCKACRRIYWQTYYAANGDRLRAEVVARREANPEQRAAAQRAWREANPERDADRKKTWREANPERDAATTKAWAEANPERRAASNKAWREAHPEHSRVKWLRSAYGISQADYAEMLEAQEHGCAICGKTKAEEGMRLSVDHDHDTGKVRGLLCGSCNRAIGLLRHDPELLRSATVYLDQWMQG